MKIKEILLLAIVLVLAGCGSQGGDTNREAEMDSGSERVDREFAGQSVYDLPNEQFSESAMEILMDCGLADADIARLEKEILPEESPESGPYRDTSGNEIADISLEQLEPGIFEVFCVPENPSVWLNAGRDMILFSSSRAITDDADGELYVTGADGNGLWRLTNNDWHDYDPDWSATHSRIVFSAGYNEIFDIFTMDIDGTDIRRLTDNNWRDMHPSWSPDGSMLVFISDRDGDYDIYSMNADGSNIEQLMQNKDDELNPEWSPDGSKIVFESWPSFEIFTMSADGSNIQQLTDNDWVDMHPSWSPDGTKIAFASDRDGKFDIFTMRADGANITQLSKAQDANHPLWSADGSMITYKSHVVVDNVAHSMLFTMNSDGTNIQQLFDEIQVDWSFSSPEWVTQTVALPRITTALADPIETPTVKITPATTMVPTPKPEAPTQPLLSNIQMVSPEIGWAIDRNENAVLRTEDSGETWRDVSPPEKKAEDVEEFGKEPHIETIDAEHAWVLYEPKPYGGAYGCIAADAQVWYTIDGGQTWDASQPIMHNLGDMSCRTTIDMTDTQNGWLSINGWYTGAGPHTELQIFQTMDGGNTWEAPEALWCYSEDSCSSYTPGWISEKAFYGQSGWLLENMHDCHPCYGNTPAPAYHVTTDGGATWHYRNLPSPTGDPDFYEQYFFCEPYHLNLITDKIVRLQLACYQYESDATPGPKDYVYASDDGGITWTTHEMPSSSGRMIFFDKYHGLLLGREMWRTEDGGATWERINTVIWNGQFSFIDPWNGWAVAESEDGEIALVYTTNGGESWEILNPVEAE